MGFLIVRALGNPMEVVKSYDRAASKATRVAQQ